MRDPDEFVVAVSGAELKADFLSRQSSPTLVEQFQTPKWTIDYQEAEVRARILGFPPPGWAAVALISGAGQSSWYGTTVSRGFLVCTPPGEAIDGWIGPGFRCFSVGVPPEVWERCRQASGSERARSERIVAKLVPSRFGALERRLLKLREVLRSTSFHAHAEAEEVSESLMTEIWEMVREAKPLRTSSRNRTRLARRAEDWLRAHHDTCTGMNELVLAMGTSRRELEYAFRENFAMSPRTLLEGIRLNAIQRELTGSGNGDQTQVTRVALDHGITHLGRFPSLYRNLFGELPSETLARSLSISRKR